MILSSTVEKVLAGAGSISSEIEKKDLETRNKNHKKIQIEKLYRKEG